MSAIRNYSVVTAAYWGFTLSDGALRMLVLLHFHALGYSPLELATLFLLYEVMGMVTNLIGGWVGSRLGLNFTLYLGLGLQVAALLLLARLDPAWNHDFSVLYVLLVQGLAGVAKDFTKMSAKSALKLIVPEEEDGGKEGALFKWVALLTGSKNTLKGAGFFLGGFLLSSIGYDHSLYVMAAVLAVILLACPLVLPRGFGQLKAKVKFTALLSKSRDINILSAARLFLFGARDVWFVVGLPLFLYDIAGFSFTATGTLMAAWVIGYGFVQAGAPALLRGRKDPRGLFWVVLPGYRPLRHGDPRRKRARCHNGGAGGTRPVRGDFRRQQRAPQLPDPEIFRTGPCSAQCGLLLYGQCGGPPAGHDPVRPQLPVGRDKRLPAGFRQHAADRRPVHHVPARCK